MSKWASEVVEWGVIQNCGGGRSRQSKLGGRDGVVALEDIGINQDR